MNKKIIITITALTFIWVGMICGISFLEAPLKFQAPGITLELGLGIGKLVFSAMTKIEMSIALLISAGLVILKPGRNTWIYYSIPFVILVIDNAILMPILDARIDLITNGTTPPKSNAHWWYVALELIKLIGLILAGVDFIKSRVKD